MTLLVVVVVGTGLLVWFGSSQYVPIRANHEGVYSTVRAQFGPPARVEALDPATRRPLVAFDVPYRRGSWMEYGFTLVNDSPFSVTVEQIGGAAASGGPLRQISVSINAADVDALGAGAPERMVRFRPFSIPPHEARYVLVRNRFADCTLTSPDESVLFASQAVHFRIDFGWVSVDRSALLPLPYSVKVSGNDGCPA